MTLRRFRGEGDQKVDGKGRVSIPSSYRGVLNQGDPNSDGLPEFVIVYGDHRRKFLECFTMEAAAEVDDKIADMPRGTIERRMLEKLFNGQSLIVSVDNTGRIVLPAKLRQKIGIEDMAYFIATGDTFQIWKPETYAEVEEARTEEWLDQFDDDFDPLMLLDKAGAS